MTKLTSGTVYLKDFGSGTTDDPAKAHEFTGDEAYALQALYGYGMVFPYGEPSPERRTTKPDFPAGPDCVWVKLGSNWLAAERQALFIGTRKALREERERAVADMINIIEEDMA